MEVMKIHGLKCKKVHIQTNKTMLHLKTEIVLLLLFFSMRKETYKIQFITSNKNRKI